MKKRKLIVMLFTMVLCMSFTSLTAFAGGGEDETEPTPTVPTETPTELTPDGNLTLVDDIKSTDTNEKQFITMQSKNGNYFYLVIDRAGDKENVYFLNLVDEADLMALIEENPPEIVEPTTPTEPEPTVPTTPVTPEPTEPEAESGNSSVAMLALIVVIGLVGGGAFYYFKIMKPKKDSKGITNLDELEYDEDEEIIEDDEYGFDFDDIADEEIEEELNGANDNK